MHDSLFMCMCIECHACVTDMCAHDLVVCVQWCVCIGRTEENIVDFYFHVPSHSEVDFSFFDYRVPGNICHLPPPISPWGC